MNATLELHADKLALFCSPMHTELAKQIPGMRYDRSYQAWLVDASPIAIDIAWSVFEGRIEIRPEVVEYRKQWNKTYRQLEALKSGAYRDGFRDRFPDIAESLWPLQNDGVGFLAHAKTAYLCDDMGAGKTIQCARALDYIGADAFPALVVANKSALDSVWRAELEAWSTEIDDVIVVEGTAPRRRKAMAQAQELIAEGRNVVLVVGWSTLTGHSRLSPYGNISLTDKEKTPAELNEFEFKTAIIDELHKAKNWRTKWTRALWAIVHTPSVEYRWGLTGTLVTGYEEDVWAMGHTIQPEFYPLKTPWFSRYVDARDLPGREYKAIVGFRPENYDEMIRHLEPFMLRRTKPEIIPNYQGKLPIITVECEMKGKQKTAYKQMTEDMMAEGDGGLIAAPSPIEQLLRQNQFAAATPVIEEVEQEDGTTKMEVVGLTGPSGKVDQLMEKLDEMGEAQGVVFAESRLLIDYVAERLEKANISYARVTGAETGPLRTGNIESFQAGNVRMMLCTYGAAAESITLNNCDIVHRLQRSYNFVLDTQAPDRVDRGERSVPVQIIDYLTIGTTEHKVHARIEEKADVFESVVRDALRS